MSKQETQGFDISKKSAAVIGCGGLGSNIVAHLAGAGIGKLVLCDFDTVSETNLNRQFLYSQADIGRKKCDAAKEWVNNYSPETEVLAMDCKISSDWDKMAENPDVFATCDVIVLAVDNPEARNFFNNYCTEKRIPLVCGMIDGFYGMCYMYVPGKTACLECAGMTEMGKVMRSISSAAGIIGSLEAELAIRWLIDDGENAYGKLYIYDEGTLNQLSIVGQEDCLKCR